MREQSNCSHGTHVAGIIAAEDSGYIGICPYCSILVVKVVDIKIKDGKESFQIEDSAIIAGLAYVSGFTVNGEPLVRVINASFGKFQRSRSVGLLLIPFSKFGKGVLTIAAAGNEDTMKKQYPAAFDEVIAVANIESSKSLPRKSPSSNFLVHGSIYPRLEAALVLPEARGFCQVYQAALVTVQKELLWHLQ